MAQEVDQFGIKITAVAPGFFRTALLDARNAKYAKSTIEDYAVEGTAQAMWSGYDGKQLGDPAKLGELIVKLAALDDPPRQFLAGSDAFAAYKPILEGSLEEIGAHEELRFFLN